MAQGGIGYAANGLVDGFLQGYQVFHKAKEDKEYKKLKAQLIQSQITRNNRGPVARPVRDYTAQDDRAKAQADLSRARTTTEAKRAEWFARRGITTPGQAQPTDTDNILSGIPGRPTTPAQGAPNQDAPPEPPGGWPAPQAPGPQSSIPSAPNVDVAQETPTTSPDTQNFAEGGDVEDEDEKDDNDEENNEEDDDEEGSELPANSAPTQGQDDGYAQLASRYSVDAAHDAVRAGIMHTLPAPAAVDSPAQSAARMQHLRGPGAASQVDMDKIRRKVDPDGKMNDADRNMAAFSAVQTYFLKKGDPEAAKHVASSMVGYFRQEYDKNRMFAQIAAEKGDLPKAIEFAKRAYANVPDGQHIDTSRNKDGTYNYAVIDTRTGEKIDADTVTPEVMLKKVQSGAQQTFNGLIAQSAGVRMQREEKAPKPPAAIPLNVRTTAASNIESEIGKSADTLKGVPEEYKGVVASAAAHIHASNDMDPSASIKAVKELTVVGGTKMPSPAPDGSVTATLKDGSQIKLSRNAVAQIALLRVQAQKWKDGKDADEVKRAESEANRQALVTKQKSQEQVLRKTRPSPQAIARQTADQYAQPNPEPAQGAGMDHGPTPTPAWFRGAIPPRQTASYPPVQGLE